MADIRKKPVLKFLFFAGLFIYFAYTFISQQKLIYLKDVEVNSIQASIEEEEELNKDLKKQKEMIDSDEYVEKVARKELGMVKRGEKIFVDLDK